MNGWELLTLAGIGIGTLFVVRAEYRLSRTKRIH